MTHRGAAAHTQGAPRQRARTRLLRGHRGGGERSRRCGRRVRVQLRALSDGDWRAAGAVPGQLVMAETSRGPTAQVGRTVLWAAERGPAVPRVWRHRLARVDLPARLGGRRTVRRGELLYGRRRPAHQPGAAGECWRPQLPEAGQANPHEKTCQSGPGAQAWRRGPRLQGGAKACEAATTRVSKL